MLRATLRIGRQTLKVLAVRSSRAVVTLSGAKSLAFVSEMFHPVSPTGTSQYDIRAVLYCVLWLLAWLAMDVQATLAQTGPTIRLSADQITVSAGQAASVDVLIEDVTNLGSFQFNLLYDPNLVEVSGVQLGEFLAQTGRQPNPLGPRTDRPGDTAFGAFTLGGPDQRGPNGAGRLATVQLVGKQSATASLRLDRPQATDPQGQPIALVLQPTPNTGAPGGTVQATTPAGAPATPVPTPGRTLIPTVARPPVSSPTPVDGPAAGSGLPLPLLVGLAVVVIAIVVAFVIQRRQ
jgi:hypothetical protein